MSAEEDRGGEGADAPGTYAHRVVHGTLRYAEELMAENHRLRVELAAMESQHAGLVDGLQRARAERERYAAQYRDLETQNTSLANLYVASYRLHGTLDREAVLSTILEIVTNLVGCEEIAVFETDGGGTRLELAASTGIDGDAYRSLAFGAGQIGACAATGETFVAADATSPLTACVPLKLDGHVSGAIALFRLLPQKSGSEDVDRELFDLLATHAATALHCARLHARQAPAAP